MAIGCGGDGTPAGDAGPGDADAFIPEARGQFPSGFLWGSAIAPYQVEGNLHDTDWYQWESICDTCSGETADDGPDFWTHYETDLDNAVSISNNAIRLGVDWSRVFPTRESFESQTPDTAALAHYHDMLDAARERDLTIMVTLIHFALPTWVHDLEDPETAPGWESDQIVADLTAWADWAAAEFGDDVDLWITLNEPFVNLTGGWISGDVPPGKSFEIDLALEVGERMIEAHARMYDAIHAADLADVDGDGAAARVSISKHNRIFLPKDSRDPDHVRAADMLRYLLNDYMLQGIVFGNIDRNYDFDYDDAEDTADDDSLKGRLDFIGLNYYGPTLVVDTANDNNFPLIGIPLINDLDNQGFEGPVSDFGWTIFAEGLRAVIDELGRYELPIIITENGVADANDTLRPRFVADHLYVINEALDDGVDIEGYFHWTLIDNFEWGSGYCPRFGLFRVDFESTEKTRTMGEGAAAYQRIIDDNTVDPQLFADYPEYRSETTCPRVGL